jgi:hypothetical protein
MTTESAIHGHYAGSRIAHYCDGPLSPGKAGNPRQRKNQNLWSGGVGFPIYANKMRIFPIDQRILHILK